MRIQVATNELVIELDDKDLSNLTQKYLLQDKFKFSILDDESLLLSLRMEGSDRICMMYEDNELIIFLPFTEFEKWLHSDNQVYFSEKGMNASNNMSITIKKTISIPRIKTFGEAGEFRSSNRLSNRDINYN